jgi:Na+-translocating ferredoxin:NAD+ oxidoreductase RnfC subunit
MNEISTKVRAAGVVGAGGAGFPTHVKLDAKAEIYLVNGAECEPMLRTDQQLAARYPKLLIRGLQQGMKATGAKAGIIALKAKYQAAIKVLTPLLPKEISIGILRDVYPAGDEVMTIWMITGRRVPPGGIPLNIGVVVNNVQTMINVAKAMNGEAVTTRTLTVTGAVQSPLTVTVPIGTPLQELLALAGGPTCNPVAFIDGGPMMGKIIQDLSSPVTKTTGGLIALPANHLVIAHKEQSLESIFRIAKTVCEQCSYCTELCPRHIIGHELSPHMIVRSTNYNYLGDPQVICSALTCSECGVCEAYACILGISPKQINVALKNELRAKGIRYQGELRNVDVMAENRLVPMSRLVARLNLKPWYPPEALLLSKIYRPKEVTILLQQHVGAPSVPVVTMGEQVKQGQLVAEIATDALGARLHASIDGTVRKITSQAIIIEQGGGVK